MGNSVIVAVVAALGTILAAALTFGLTKKHELKVQWQHEKLNHYKALMMSISDLYVDGMDKEKANKDFALTANTIALIASQDVVTKLMMFHSGISRKNPCKSEKEFYDLLNPLLLAIRRDIGLAEKDDPSIFTFHLVGSPPS